jgi:YesN/AraC family two-component response regulator
VIEACDGEEARALAKEYNGEIHLLLTDVVMPKMSGKELADALRRDLPGLKVLLCSGYTGDTVMQQGVLDKSTPFLQKPFTVRSLAVAVRQALDAGTAGPLAKGLGTETMRGGNTGARHTA